jgi:hypothetical protein
VIFRGYLDRSSGEGSPIIWSCYASIPVLTDHENNQFLKKWTMIIFKIYISWPNCRAGFATGYRSCSTRVFELKRGDSIPAESSLNLLKLDILSVGRHIALIKIEIPMRNIGFWLESKNFLTDSVFFIETCRLQHGEKCRVSWF